MQTKANFYRSFARRVQFAAVLTLICAFAGAVPELRAESPLEVTLLVLKPAKDVDGKETLAAAPEAKPGETLVYRVVYHNRSDRALSDVRALLPIPTGLAYAEGSAEPAASEASLDGQVFFTVATPPQDTPASTWRMLRWAPRDLPPGETFVVEVRAVVETAPVSFAPAK